MSLRAAPPTLTEMIRAGTRRLTAAGVEAAAADARLLGEAALDIDRTRRLTRPDRAVSDAEATAYRTLIERRARREPISRILGRREFWSLNFRLDPAVLDPRPDSETVVSAALARLGGSAAGLRVLDLGCGSGCLLLAWLAERPADTGIGVDRLAAAAACARGNAAALGLADRARFVVGDWATALGAGRFDLVLANPPYIPSGEIDALAPEVAAHDPLTALDGGPDGLAAYRALAGDLDRLLVAGGVAVLEIGAGQAAAVAGLLDRRGLCKIAAVRDIAGRNRVVVAEKAVGKTEKSG